MKTAICLFFAFIVILAVGREGKSIYQVGCHDSVRSYVQYERMSADWENDICN